MGRGKDLESYIKEATANIREDRATVKFLLADLLAAIQKNKHDSSHATYGIIASKYVETLQRSNEQLVKITSLVQKDTKVETGLTSEDKQEIFDLIKEEEHS
jgi:translation initiation factor 2 beta subunit (eIF-2beta)/eIF-5